MKEVNYCHDYHFSSGKNMSRALDFDVSRNLHCFMGHVKEQLLMNGCIRLFSTEKNKFENKKDKKKYCST